LQVIELCRALVPKLDGEVIRIKLGRDNLFAATRLSNRHAMD